MIFWKQLWMERDGTTPCWVRIGTIVGLICYLAYSAHQVYKSGTFDYVAFATGFTTILVGGAGGTRIKLDTEGAAGGQ